MRRAAVRLLWLLAVPAGVLAEEPALFQEDLSAPEVSILSPAAGQPLGETVRLSAAATDASSGVAKLVFEVRAGAGLGAGQVVFSAEDLTEPYEAAWPAALAPNGPYSLRVRGMDRAGNVGYAAARSFTLQNDIQPPSVRLTSPRADAFLRGLISFGAAASDAGSGVTRVVFEVTAHSGPDAGQVVFASTDTRPPYAAAWNASAARNGPYSVQVRAVDGKGNAGYSFDPPFGSRPFLVDNDVTPPSVAFLGLRAGASLEGGVLLTAEAADASGVARVVFSVDGRPFATDTWPPYRVSWNTRRVPDGAHVLTAEAYDRRGFSSRTALSVTVSNWVGPSAKAAPADRESGAKAEQKFLSPALADGINDAAVFGPEAEGVLILDARGRVVYEASRSGGQGTLSWDARDRRGEIVDSGAYRARIRKKDGTTDAQTIVVVK